MMVAIPSSAVYSVVTPIRQATGLSLTDINNGTGTMVRLLKRRNTSEETNQLRYLVPVLRLGLRDLAAFGLAVWKAASLYLLHRR